MNRQLQISAVFMLLISISSVSAMQRAAMQMAKMPACPFWKEVLLAVKKYEKAKDKYVRNYFDYGEHGRSYYKSFHNTFRLKEWKQAAAHLKRAEEERQEKEDQLQQIDQEQVEIFRNARYFKCCSCRCRDIASNALKSSYSRNTEGLLEVLSFTE